MNCFIILFHHVVLWQLHTDRHDGMECRRALFSWHLIGWTDLGISIFVPLETSFTGFVNAVIPLLRVPAWGHSYLWVNMLSNVLLICGLSMLTTQWIDQHRKCLVKFIVACTFYCRNWWTSLHDMMFRHPFAYHLSTVCHCHRDGLSRFDIVLFSVPQLKWI